MAPLSLHNIMSEAPDLLVAFSINGDGHSPYRGIDEYNTDDNCNGFSTIIIGIER